MIPPQKFACRCQYVSEDGTPVFEIPLKREEKLVLKKLEKMRQRTPLKENKPLSSFSPNNSKERTNLKISSEAN